MGLWRKIPYPRTLGALLSLLSFVAALAAIHWLLGRRASPEQMRDWIGQFGLWSPLLFVLVYALASLVFFPTLVLTLAAALLWEWKQAFLWVVLGTNLGANLAFWIGRWLGRDRVQKIMHVRVLEIQRMIVDAGVRTFFILRLIPLVPYAPLNYAAGVTLVRWRDYFLGSFLGMLPVTLLYVYIGGNLQWSNPKLWLALIALALLALSPAFFKRQTRSS